jgi:hypothetical protein
MEKYFFMRQLLDRLASPGVFNKVVAITLRAVAGLAILFSLVAFFKAGKVIFELPASGIPGGLIFQACFVVAIYAVTHVLFIRARDIENLASDSACILPMASLLFRMFGEIFSAFVSLVAVGGGVYVWFTGRGVATIMNPVPIFFPSFGDTTFLGGIEFMVGGVLMAIGVLLLMYMLSDMVAYLATAMRQRGTPTPGSGPAS